MSNPLHHDYCNCNCPQGLSYDKLEQTLNRVRMVHQCKVAGDVVFCVECDDVYPCATQRALQGDDDVL